MLLSWESERSIRDRLRRLCGEGGLCFASAVADTIAKKPTWCLTSEADLAYQLS